MDAIILMVLMKEIWEKFNVISILALLGLFGTLITYFITWRTDREKLKNLEMEKDRIRDDFEKHKLNNTETFKDIRESIHHSNNDVIKRVDELMWYLMHSKIHIKGKEDENNNS